MTTTRRIKAIDVLRAVERDGPIRVSALIWTLEQVIDTDRQNTWEDRCDFAAAMSALRWGRFIWIAKLDGDVELWGTTSAGRALLTARREKGRIS